MNPNQFLGSQGGFSLESFRRAKAAGYSDQDIYNALGSWGGTIGTDLRTQMAAFNQQKSTSTGGVGLAAYQRALASGQTADQFFADAKSRGLQIGDQLQGAYNSWLKSQQPLKINKNNTLRENIKIAGAGNGNISKKEILKIANKNDVSADKIIKNMDIINSNNKKANLGLGSAAVNAYVKGNLPSESRTYSQMGNMTFGADIYNNLAGNGKIASTLNSYLGAPIPMVKGQGGGVTNGVTQGKLPPITAGNQINSRGGVTTIIPGSGLPKNNGSTSSAPPPTPTVVNPTTPTDTPTYTPPEMETPAPQYGPGGPGSALDGGATGFRPRRSRWRTSGQTTKGTANLKINGQTGRSSGVNLATGLAAAGLGMFG
jgi:hypothetical protein